MSESAKLLVGLLGVALGLVACSGDDIDRPPLADSGFSTEGPLDAGAFDDDADEGDEGGEPDPDPNALCDAGDEAWVKRAIPFIQGRKPDSIREVRMLVSAIEQLDDDDQDGRRLVARALAHGDRYLERWKVYLYEHLRVQRTGDRLNTFCYDYRTPAGLDETFAAGVRDGAPVDDILGLPLTESPTMADLTTSALMLDDVSPVYRADLFARMAAPLTGGNVTREELEVSNRALFGGLFEAVYLGRNTECLQCHITTQATTLRADPETNRHWSVHPDTNIEMAVYGPFEYSQETRELAEVHAIFQHAGVVDYTWCTEGAGCDPLALGTTPGQPVWGMTPNCGMFRDDHYDDPAVGLEDDVPFMAGEFGAGTNANIFDLEQRLHRGMDALSAEGLTASGGGAYLEPDDPEAAMAFLFSMNFAEGIWKEAMGHPLTVANKFPRNPAQRDTLQTLAETFFSSHYSLRELLVEVSVNEHFNVAAPDVCGNASAYPMAALFDPFTKEAADPTERGNGVGDMLHRYSAAVLLDSAAQAMWWTRFNRFNAQEAAAFLAAWLDPPLDTLGANGTITQINPMTGTNLACCGAGYCPPCYDEPNRAGLLRDLGLHMSQFDAGFNGTDFNGLLHWEAELADGRDPELGNPMTECTGPLGAEDCAAQDYISTLVNVGATATMRDIAVALKDRLLTEPTIGEGAETAAIEAIMGESLDTAVNAAADPFASARRYAGVLFNTPQFMLDGAPSRDQPPENDPVIVVPGTDTSTSCNYFMSLTQQTEEWAGYNVACTPQGITVQ